MNIATLAEKLHNTEYPINIPQDILDEAKANRLVILCGYSDDMMDFSGAISDEVDAMNGGTAIVHPGGLLGSRDDIDEDEAMEAWLKAKKQAVEKMITPGRTVQQSLMPPSTLLRVMKNIAGVSCLASMICRRATRNSDAV